MRVGAALNLLSCLGMTEENWVRLATSQDSQHTDEQKHTHLRPCLFIWCARQELIL